MKASLASDSKKSKSQYFFSSMQGSIQLDKTRGLGWSVCLAVGYEQMVFQAFRTLASSEGSGQ